MPQSSRRLTLLISWILLGFAHSAQSAPSIMDRPQPVCTYLTRMSNAGALAGVIVRGRLANNRAIPVPAALAGQQLAFADLLDVNNDAKLEYVYIVQYSPWHEDPSSASFREGIIVGAERIIPRYFSIPWARRPQQETATA